MQLQQGDLFFESVDDVPGDAQRIESEGPIVLATGSATGHSHTIDSAKAELYEKESQRFVRVVDKVDLVHVGHHDPVEFPKGTFSVVRQTQWTDNGVERVSD